MVAIRNANPKTAILRNHISAQGMLDQEPRDKAAVVSASGDERTALRLEMQRESGVHPNLPMPLLAHEFGNPPWLSASSMFLKRGIKVTTKMP